MAIAHGRDSGEGLDGLKGRSLRTLLDLSPSEIDSLIELAKTLKAERKAGHLRRSLEGKSLGLLFFKSSTRTRVSFEVAARELGGDSYFFHADDLQLGRGESLEDTARVLSRYLHGLVIRTFEHEEIEAWAKWATVPVINGLTDDFHPVQVLADLLTLSERFGELKGLRLVYVGDGNNMAHSLMLGGAMMGMEVVVSTPPDYLPKQSIVELAQNEADRRGGSIQLVADPHEAVEGAHAIYTDTWVSMGQEDERSTKLQAFSGYQVNRELVGRARSDVVVMHCLPGHKDEEISTEVFEGPHSIVFDQAENRLHAQKALLHAVMGR